MKYLIFIPIACLLSYKKSRSLADASRFAFMQELCKPIICGLKYLAFFYLISLRSEREKGKIVMFFLYIAESV